MLSGNREMPTEIEHGDRTHFLAVPFGADEAMREVGFAGGGTSGLRATDVQAKTLPRNPTGRNRGPEILWLYFLQLECLIAQFQ